MTPINAKDALIVLLINETQLDEAGLI